MGEVISNQWLGHFVREFFGMVLSKALKTKTSFAAVFPQQCHCATRLLGCLVYFRWRARVPSTDDIFLILMVIPSIGIVLADTRRNHSFLGLICSRNCIALSPSVLFWRFWRLKYCFKLSTLHLG